MKLATPGWPVVTLSRPSRRPPSPPTFYKIDPEHTSVIFSAAHTGLSYTYGMFRDVSGQYQLDKANPSNSKFQMVIRADSLDTNNAERDKHLRSPDFFDVQQFPEITFESTRCEFIDTPESGKRLPARRHAHDPRRTTASPSQPANAGRRTRRQRQRPSHRIPLPVRAQAQRFQDDQPARKTTWSATRSASPSASKASSKRPPGTAPALAICSTCTQLPCV